jgi:hypothetical protein
MMMLRITMISIASILKVMYHSLEQVKRRAGHKSQLDSNYVAEKESKTD